MRSTLAITRHPFVAFLGALGLGLTLALAVGAVASTRQSTGTFNKQRASVEAAGAARPDVSVMRVFKRGPVSGDVVPASVAKTLSQFSGAPVAENLKPGNAVSGTARRAISGVGSTNASLYLVPTDRGSVCMLWAPDVYGGGCTQGFDTNTHVVYVRGSVDGHAYLWGILRDDVASLTAEVNGNTAPVVSGESAFFYQGDTLPSALSLTLTDGATQTVAVGPLPGALK